MKPAIKLFSTLAVLGCATTAASTTASVGPCTDVPATAPNRKPPEYDSLRIAIEGFGQRVMPNIVLVRFANGTTRREKADAICSVNGVAVGGYEVSGTEGIYIVRVRGERVEQTLKTAMERLRTWPQVSFVGPEAIVDF